MRNFRAFHWVPLLSALCLAWAPPALAQVEQEIAWVGEVVDVIDAFDEGDPFDFTFRATYGFELTRTKLTQQCAPGLDAAAQAQCRPDQAGVIGFRDIARYTQERHTLTLDAIFGLYRDLNLYTSWPFILMDRRELELLSESDVQAVHPDNELLFRFPFRAHDRSGVDQMALGLSWLPFSQQRRPTLPTWLLNVEGRFAVGEGMKPSCSTEEGNVAYAAPGGTTAPCNTETGASQRTNDLRVRTTLSRRLGMLEPYIGFLTHISFPEKSDTERYGDSFNIPVYVETHFGLEIVPWERLQGEQFLRIGLHFWGGWSRETLDYSPLYDILGTNQNMNHDIRDTTAPTTDEWGSQREFSGLTRVEGHGTFGGRLTLTMQAARYVKFAVILGLAHVQEHFITFSDECRVPRFDEDPDAEGAENSCFATGGIFVPEWRPQVDNIGRRFRAEQTTVFNVGVNVNVQL
jgi:hypothetical protein